MMKPRFLHPWPWDQLPEQMRRIVAQDPMHPLSAPEGEDDFEGVPHSHISYVYPVCHSRTDRPKAILLMEVVDAFDVPPPAVGEVLTLRGERVVVTKIEDSGVQDDESGIPAAYRTVHVREAEGGLHV